MNPAFLDNMSWEIAEVYGAITDQILINLSRYFKYYTPGDKIPRTAFEYQAGMLAQMGKVNRDTIRIIRNGLDGADEALKSTLEQAIIDSVSKSQPELLKGVKAGILAPQGVPIVAPNQMRAFKLFYEQSADRLNLVNTVMLESTKSAYQQTISDVINDIALSDRIAATYEAVDVAAGEVVTGISSWNTALRHATDRLKNRGITGFIDHAGRQWSAEAYVAMDVRTTTFNVGRAAVWEQNQDFGNDLYLVSYHNGARPGCYDWQNKVISSLNVSRDVVDLDGNTVHVYAQSDTTYGQPAGLFGINCKHYPTPFIPGVSIADGKPQSPEENEKTYKESQEQRRLERKLREEKRDYLMAREQGASPEELTALKNKTRQTSQEIDDFCEQTGRARHRDREAVYTKREFPDKKKYDVTAFKHEQQNAINEYFKDGGAQQRFKAEQMTPNEPTTPTPATPVTQTPPVSPAVTPQEITVPNPAVNTFNPAKTIDEAEQYARESFYNSRTFGAQGVSYSGVSLDTANAVNKRLTEFFDTYNVDKFGGITAPAGNTKLGKRIDGANAAFGTVNRHLMLSRKNLKTPETIIKSLADEKKFVNEYLQNPSKFPKLDNVSKKILDASAQSGRATVADNLTDVLNHELGHSLEKALRGVDNYGLIESAWKDYSIKISGYATTSFGEYIAESHCAWCKGEVIEPELIKGFMALMR